MRGRTKVISIAAILTVIFVSSMIFSSGLLNVSSLSLFSSPMYPDSPDSNVFITPATTIKDYINNPGYKIGNLLQVHVNITGAVDLFSYQVNVTWSPSMLNFSRVVSYGDFLARTGSPYGTSRIEPTWTASNVTGRASIAETILGDVTGISGDGRLFTIEFQIVGYGATWIQIGTGGTLPTMLLESTGVTHAYTTTNGYFKNKLNGDANGDKTVNILDMGTLSGRWTGAPGALPYSRDIDCNDDGVINILDMGVVSANWGRTTP